MTTDYPLWSWVAFCVGVGLLLALDFFVLHREGKIISLRRAGIEYVGWLAIAGLFNLALFATLGSEKGLEFLTGYLIEVSLSADNVFVWLVVILYFSVRPEYQHRVLLIGILGAIILRGIFIGAGVALLHYFDWIIYVFGAFLIYTGGKMAFSNDEEVDPDKNIVVRLARRLFPVSSDHHGDKFFVKVDGKLIATPLFLVAIALTAIDIMFAVDSIPAILSITQDPYIVWTSNVGAILGLRALFFLISRVVAYFRYLKVGLSAILVFVGLKMLTSEIYHMPILLSLGVVVGILFLSIVASIIANMRDPKVEAEGNHT